MANEKFNFIQPFKDIPRTLKGFPKNLVHIWKDPVTNSAQIPERKREIFPYIYLFAGLFLVFVILSVVIPSAQGILMVVSIIPGFGIILGAFLLVVLKKAQEKFADLECTNCKERITYGSNVQIEVMDRKFVVNKKSTTINDRNGVPEFATITASGKETTTAKIMCKCQACGAEKTFNHDFVTVECEKSGVRVPYVQSGALLVQYEHDVRQDGAEGFEGKSGTTDRGVKIKYNRSIQTLVAGYFGNEIQMR